LRCRLIFGAVDLLAAAVAAEGGGMYILRVSYRLNEFYDMLCSRNHIYLSFFSSQFTIHFMALFDFFLFAFRRIDIKV
jgi:hypothetical protein